MSIAARAGRQVSGADHWVPVMMHTVGNHILCMAGGLQKPGATETTPDPE